VKNDVHYVVAVRAEAEGAELEIDQRVRHRKVVDHVLAAPDARERIRGSEYVVLLDDDVIVPEKTGVERGVEGGEDGDDQERSEKDRAAPPGGPRLLLLA
jgi:hypothetical protein